VTEFVSPPGDDDRPAVGVPETLLGVGFAVGGVALFFSARGMPGLGDLALGPGSLPELLGLGFAGLGTLLALKGLGELRDLLAGRAVLFRLGGLTWFPVVVLVALVAYLALMTTVGFIPLTIAFVFGVALAGGARPIPGAVFAVAVTVVIHLLFVGLLRVPLPSGFFG
jgi:hypothetical protein